MNFAVMGAGFWTRFQLYGWGEVKGARPIAICDPDLDKAAALAADFGIPEVFGDVDTMLRQVKPDFLDIVSTVGSHALGVESSVRHGIPVICQKPMGTSLSECEQMVNNARDVPFFIHENWRYQAPMRELWNVIDSGEIGDPFRARLQFSCSFPVFDNQPALAQLDRFIITDIGSHVLDCARFLFGEARWLHATTARIGPIKGEDVATVIMEMQRCPTVICEMSYASRMSDEAFPETYVTVEGSRGSAELRKGLQLLVTTVAGTRSQAVVPHRYAWADPAYDMVHASIVDTNRALFRALKGEATAETTAKDNLNTMCLVFGAYDSAQKREIVKL